MPICAYIQCNNYFEITRTSGVKKKFCCRRCKKDENNREYRNAYRKKKAAIRSAGRKKAKKHTEARQNASENCALYKICGDEAKRNIHFRFKCLNCENFRQNGKGKVDVMTNNLSDYEEYKIWV